MNEKSTRLRLLMVLVVGILAVYVLLNIVLVSFVPMLYPLELKLLIEDAQSKAPVSGARVSWLHSRPNGQVRSEVGGTSDSQGRVNVTTMIQEQPLWAFPRIGSFSFQGLSLGIVASGYQESSNKMSDILPDQRFAEPRAEAIIGLDRSAPGRDTSH